MILYHWLCLQTLNWNSLCKFFFFFFSFSVFLFIEIHNKQSKTKKMENRETKQQKFDLSKNEIHSMTITARDLFI